jgi:hypothetical protein
MSEDSYKNIMKALDMLEAEGVKHIKPEYQKDYPRWQAIGLAIAEVDRSAKNVLHLAYSALEDWNYHSINLVIEWIASLYGQTFHERDLVTLARMINKQGVTIFTEWDSELTAYKTKVVNVRVVIEDAPEDEMEVTQ